MQIADPETTGDVTVVKRRAAYGNSLTYIMTVCSYRSSITGQAVVMFGSDRNASGIMVSASSERGHNDLWSRAA